jgi:cytochrome c oxidase subunit II
MTTVYLITAILVLAFIVIFQIGKASEYVSILKGSKKAADQNNRLNGTFMIVFLVVGLIGAWYCNEALYKKTLLWQPSASDHGAKIDTLMWITLAITGAVFLLTQILLFWFAYKYQAKENRKAFYFPHDNRLEVLWTVVPAIALTVLVGMGLFYWFKITGEAPKDAQIVEVTGHQFGWDFRYPGKDGVLGRKNWKFTDAGNNNPLGQDWKDANNHDDIIANELRLIKGKPVKLIINAQDVIHDVGLPHFRMKMDAVPGTPTTMWFTPMYTTEEMKKITGNKDFLYELSCDQMCGRGHYSMRAIVVVETQEEHNRWLAGLKPKYASTLTN